MTSIGFLPLCFSALFLCVAFPQSVMAQIEFNFPQEDVPVLRVDEYYSEANKGRRPTLLVYSDGRVVRSVSDDMADDYEFTLGESKFKEVLNEIFVKNEFATISDAAILKEISSRPKRKRPLSTSFRVTTNTSEGAHSVAFGNPWLHDRLGLGRKRHIDAEQLQRFLQVEEACRELSNLALIGGTEAFQAVMKEANAKFKQTYPNGPDVSEIDLKSVRLNSFGEVAVRFMFGSNVVKRYPVSVWCKKARGQDDWRFEVKVDKPLEIHGRNPRQ